MGFDHRDYFGSEGAEPPVHIIPAEAVSRVFLPPAPPHEPSPTRFLLLPIHRDGSVEISGVRFRAPREGEEGHYLVSYEVGVWLPGWSIEMTAVEVMVERVAESRK